MAYLTILAIGGFGLLIAGVSHYFVSRERREIHEAQSSLDECVSSEDRISQVELPTSVAGSANPETAKRGRTRLTSASAKQYSKRVVLK
ncbi:MAG: hypothetical protein O9289_17875 [Rhodobacteraceae bacterium]|nr:hypothetical protein [Paracoccaceae bacterium]MCZ8085072.1 hypothetical protein [Paracoccaceae bacterium]